MSYVIWFELVEFVFDRSFGGQLWKHLSEVNIYICIHIANWKGKRIPLSTPRNIIFFYLYSTSFLKPRCRGSLFLSQREKRQRVSGQIISDLFYPKIISRIFWKTIILYICLAILYSLVIKNLSNKAFMVFSLVFDHVSLPLFNKIFTEQSMSIILQNFWMLFAPLPPLDFLTGHLVTLQSPPKHQTPWKYP